MLRIAFSNRFETLLDGLVAALADPPASPFESQHVVVPSMAVRGRIELALADRLGICANVEFSFLGAWLWRQIARLVEVADNRDGTLSIFTTVIDHAGPADYGGNLSNPVALAGLSRELSVNDPQVNLGARGTVADRNTELLVGAPADL